MPLQNQIIVKTYTGSQSEAMAFYQADADKMAAQGYFPTSQSWAPGAWGFGSFLVALILCLVLIGILVFVYMLIVTPDGTLSVTYELRTISAEEKTCPMCAERVKEAALECRFCGHKFAPASSSPAVPGAGEQNTVAPSKFVATLAQASSPIPEHDIVGIVEPTASSPHNKKIVIAFVLLILCAAILLVFFSASSMFFQTNGETSAVGAEQTSAVPPVFDFAAMKQAAEHGDVDAQNKLGAMYFEGNGAPLDYGEALIWFQKSADQGHAKAQYNLGQMYRQGKGLPQDLGKAIVWYQKSADQGFAPAQTALGVAYAGQQGIPKNEAEAAKWWRRAADQDYAKAEVKLGVAYQEGIGVPKDNTEAVKWWRKAAGQNDAEAQYLLGGAYYTGDGVPKDSTEAAKWFQKAAYQGNAAAKDILRLLQKASGAPVLAHAEATSNTPVEFVTAPGGNVVYYIMSLPGKDAEGNQNMEIEVSVNENRSFDVLLTSTPSNDPAQNLTGFSHLFLSPDSKTLYFQAEAWATSNAIHAINLATKKVSYVAAGTLHCVVLSGQYQSDLVVAQHRYFVQGGSHDDLWLYDPAGKEIGLASQGTDASQVCPSLGN